jgi:hypothetical protein
MKNAAFKNSMLAASAAMILSMAAFAAPASAGESRLMAYAPLEETAPSVFDRFDNNPAPQISEEEYYEGHELNDAWLGMPVRSSDGLETGWVNDAILDENGDVVTVMVDYNGRTHAVDARYAELGYDQVDISLTRSQIAALGSSESEYEVSQAERNPVAMFADRIRAAFEPDRN